MTYTLRIVDIPVSEAPRERLLTKGANNLATAELIAILLLKSSLNLNYS